MAPTTFGIFRFYSERVIDSSCKLCANIITYPTPLISLIIYCSCPQVFPAYLGFNYNIQSLFIKLVLTELLR